MQRPETYLPQDDYVITQATYLSDFDQKVATRLYQPLIGPVAFALYLTLWQEVTPRPSLSDRKKHVRLLDLLHVSIDELFTARVKLEAVGLLKHTHKSINSGAFMPTNSMHQSARIVFQR